MIDEVSLRQNCLWTPENKRNKSRTLWNLTLNCVK